MNTFDDICRELSADLAAAVEAQTERTLRPCTPAKKPSGIEEIRQRIQKAFETVRSGVTAELRTAPRPRQVPMVKAAARPPSNPCQPSLGVL